MITDDDIRALFAHHCECRGLEGANTARISHSHSHDCDTAYTDDIRTALHGFIVDDGEDRHAPACGSPHPWITAVTDEVRIEARQRIERILESRAMTIACPSCNAEPGWFCQSPKYTGVRQGSSHTERIRAGIASKLDPITKPKYWITIHDAGKREQRALKWWWVVESSTADVGSHATAFGDAEYAPMLDAIRWRDVIRTVEEINAMEATGSRHVVADAFRCGCSGNTCSNAAEHRCKLARAIGRHTATCEWCESLARRSARES